MWLRPGRVGGSEHAAVAILDEMVGDTRVEPHLFVLDEFAPAHPELAAAFPLTTAPLRGRFRALRVGWENTWLPQQLERIGADVVHHLGGTAPMLAGGPPRHLTVHDLQPLAMPENFSPAKVRFLSAAIPRGVQTSATVSVPSPAVRADVIDRCAGDPDRIAVVPWGGPVARDVAPFRSRRPFALYPAVTWHHKNHLALVEAWRSVPDLDLVLCGGPGPRDDDVDRAIVDSGLADRVHRVGSVSADRLASLYRGAELVVFPSAFEGFGLPLLEAAVYGCPVAASDLAALDQVSVPDVPRLAVAAPSTWADTIARWRSDDALRGRWVTEAAKLAATFTWSRTVDGVVAQYRAALDPVSASKP